MQVVVSNYREWRERSRALLSSGTSPGTADFVDERAGEPLLEFAGAAAEPACASFRVPREFLELARLAACYREPQRWNLLYRVLWRLTHGEPELLNIEMDDDTHRLKLMVQAVARDIHKMHAFVRFRKVEGESGEDEYVAWYRPDHLIVEQAVPFFVRRFGSMRWAILTADESAYWDKECLRFGPGAPRREAPAEDALESLWRTYYASVFNPARVKERAMKAEMPVRFWGTLPEARLIPELLANAKRRVVEMAETQVPSAAPWVPDKPSLPKLIAAAKGCEGCDLFRHATQTVFGEGPAKAPVIMVGEQPGDQEDLRGHPFVGPAGKLLDRALEQAGVDRSQIYVTNAVKHFKFVERGKRRIHAKPSGIEVSACKPWLEAEIEVIQPELVVCLGATAAQSLMGRAFRITRDRGTLFPHRTARRLLATIHPSALLRVPEPERREDEFRLFVQDLRVIREQVPAVAL